MNLHPVVALSSRCHSHSHSFDGAVEFQDDKTNITKFTLTDSIHYAFCFTITTLKTLLCIPCFTCQSDFHLWLWEQRNVCLKIFCISRT